MMQHIVDKLKMDAAVIYLFEYGITVDQIKHYIANAPLENMYTTAQKNMERKITGTGAEPPKQGYIFKVDSQFLPDDIKNANPALLESSGANEFIRIAFEEEIARRMEEFKSKDMSEGGIVESPANFIGNHDSIEFVAPLKALEDFLTRRFPAKHEDIKPLKNLHDKMMKGEFSTKPTE